MNCYREKIKKDIPILLKKYNVPGIAIAIIENGEIVELFGYGMADKNKLKEVNKNTIMQIGSISKAVTAWGVMKLVQEGKLDLDKPVDLYLKRWHLPKGKYNSNEVTIRRILSHTASLSTRAYSGILQCDKLPTLEESLSGMAYGTKGLIIKSKPGKNVIYSGGGYTLLQLLLEDVVEESFSIYMDKEILNPLNMYNSSFDYENIDKIELAHCYNAFGKEKPNYLFIEKAAAGLYTSIDDLSKFLIANMINSYKNKRQAYVLSIDNLQLMQKRVNRAVDYGLGFNIITLPKGIKMLIHNGINKGWCSKIALMPNEGNGIAIMTNSDNGNNIIIDVMISWLEDFINPIPPYYMRTLGFMKRSKCYNYVNDLLKKPFLKIVN